MRSKSLVGLVVAALVFTFTFALAAGAEETTDASAAATKDEGSEQPLRFAEGERTSQADARAVTGVSGPLVGTRVGTLTTDGDAFIDLITIPRPDCTAGEGASFVLQDEDGTQADYIEGTNVQIDEGDPGLRVVGLGVQNANISPLNIRGGDGILDSGGLVIVTSTDIECTDDNPPPPDNPPPDNPPPDNPPPDNPPPDNSPPPSASPQPEPQDRDKGPLAGGVAVGKDVLVPGDVIDVLPDGTRVVGIDQIVIKTENCKLTAQGDDLTITMSDQGVPFRIRDGQNADISIEPDGTIVANGRRTLGDDFPPGLRDNPDRLIVPIPVDPENDQFAREPNSRFPIISSTRIEGQGCHVVENADTGNAADNGSMDNGGDTSSKNDVIPDTTSKKPLPETGGVPLYGAIVFGLVLASAGVLLFSISAFQPVSTSARRRSTRFRQPPTG
jgi:hypothetical protein